MLGITNTFIPQSIYLISLYFEFCTMVSNFAIVLETFCTLRDISQCLLCYELKVEERAPSFSSRSLLLPFLDWANCQQSLFSFSLPLTDCATKSCIYIYVTIFRAMWLCMAYFPSLGREMHLFQVFAPSYYIDGLNSQQNILLLLSNWWAAFIQYLQ